MEKGRRQKTGDRRQKTGDRRQRTEVRGQRAESSTTLLFPQVAEPVEASGNPEDVMVPR